MSITKTLIDPAVSYIDSTWTTSTNTSEKIYARTANLLLAPVVLITCALDTILGLGATLGVVCTLGRHNIIADQAATLMLHSTKLLTAPYMQLLKTIDPKQRSYEKKYTNNYTCDKGLLTEKITFIFAHILKISKSQNFFNRHIVSRLCFALLAMASLVTRVVDGLIGVLAASVSLLTLGYFHNVNQIAYQNLQAPGIITDIFVCILGILNPQAYN
jgi:hypothetical protein